MSTGSGGRPFTAAVWNVSSTAGSVSAAAAAEEISRQELVAGGQLLALDFNASALDAGTTYTFGLRLTNHLGASTFARHTVTKVEIPLPALTIPGNPQRTVLRSEPLALFASAKAPACTLCPAACTAGHLDPGTCHLYLSEYGNCGDSDAHMSGTDCRACAPSSQKLTYTWTVEGGVPANDGASGGGTTNALALMNITAANDPRWLRVPASFMRSYFAAGGEYTITVTVSTDGSSATTPHMSRSSAPPARCVQPSPAATGPSVARTHFMWMEVCQATPTPCLALPTTASTSVGAVPLSLPASRTAACRQKQC
jgi:hypothetical protein